MCENLRLFWALLKATDFPTAVAKNDVNTTTK